MVPSFCVQRTSTFIFRRKSMKFFNYTDLTGFHQPVELPGASLKTCQVLRDCRVTKFLVSLLFLAAVLALVNVGMGAETAVYATHAHNNLMSEPDNQNAADHTWHWQNPLPHGNTNWGVWAADANNVWTVGDFGNIVKWNGSSWQFQPSGTTEWLYDVWGLDVNNVWAVGSGGTIIKWNGSSWQTQDRGTTGLLLSVWGLDANNVWAVGSNGAIFKWNGSSWQAQTSGTTETLWGIWGLDASNVWTVGDNGVILKWNGSSWQAQTDDPGERQHLAGTNQRHDPRSGERLGRGR
jgi:hypothetical protein